jgi:5-methylcytosine-specific restriction endonuclease McrA
MRAKDIDKKMFIDICKNENSMAKAANVLGLHFNTFKKYALKYECYITNQSGKGLKKDIKKRIQNIEEYSTRASVRKMILKENLIEYECRICKINTWNNEKLSLHLDHINGKNSDHRLENLRWLCPNCHSQTNSYTGRNKNEHFPRFSRNVC